MSAKKNAKMNSQLDDHFMLMRNKMERKSSVLKIAISYSLIEDKLLVSFNLNINENYYEDIISIFNSIVKYLIKSKFNSKLQ